MSDKLTPMFQQWRAAKEQHPEAILLFRMGDFYELFGEDAVVASRELELTLTARASSKDNPIPMCGMPHHAVQRYVAQLIERGYKVALCDQMEDPKKAKGLVKREVTRVLSAGTLLEDEMLEPGANNFLCALTAQERTYGLAVADVSTGQFFVTELAANGGVEPVVEELARLQPAECLLSAALLERDGLRPALQRSVSAPLTEFHLDPLSLHSPTERLTRHFGTTSLRGFGCEEMPAAIEAAATVLDYLQQHQVTAAQHMRSLTVYSTEAFMLLDSASRTNLELVRSLRDGGTYGTLLWLLDRTCTSMGARLLRQWLLQPLVDVTPIRRRLEAVGELHQSRLRREELQEKLGQVRDLQRLVGKAATGTANARDLVALRSSLGQLPGVAELLTGQRCEALASCRDRTDACPELHDLLCRALSDEPPVGVREGGLIRDGYNPQLDQLRSSSGEGKTWIAELESTERDRTGIKSLKVGFNSVFGYYIEVTKPNLSQVPENYIRKQTLANGERFITPDLKEYEARVLGADEKAVELEYDLFCEVRDQVAREASRILTTAAALAELDVLTCFADLAARNRYVRPEVDDSAGILLKDGRHPVVEHTQEEAFVPNDVRLDDTENQLLIITGPNMAGKSTYLRQTALIVLMAQIGSFVPASEAKIGVVDRLFTRVGARDDLSTGQSTFMVEMHETANILHNATHRSLVILDEIGRGTSTFDGLSLAWAVSEYLHDLGAKTLFATHYHHLNELGEQLPRARNYRVEVKEKGDDIVFLRRIVPGGTDRSYGIQVARLAGLPHEVIERAKQVLWTLEEEKNIGQVAPAARQVKKVETPVQLKLFELTPHPVIALLGDLDVNQLTPIEALAKLSELKSRATETA